MLHRAEGRRRGFFERGRPNGMCTAKRDVVMYGVVYPVACISVDVVCIPWLSYCEYCFIASAAHRVHRHRKSLDTSTDAGRTHPGRDLGALRASAPPGGGIQFRPGERPLSRQKQAALCTNATCLSRLRRRPSHHFIVHAPKARQGNGERQTWAPHVAQV